MNSATTRLYRRSLGNGDLAAWKAGCSDASLRSQGCLPDEPVRKLPGQCSDGERLSSLKIERMARKIEPSRNKRTSRAGKDDDSAVMLTPGKSGTVEGK
ncbi:hypothetical protein FHS78_000908 [Parvibaculum indicum]|uniref:hypothetical protein n=1 Tax=Parvibaculum indicum TaxID=562969 RepID=UPI001421E85D|nr:hypothetical protein [Parvibaculum indicum]